MTQTGIPKELQALLKAIHKHSDDCHRAVCSVFLVHNSSQELPFGVRITKAQGSFMYDFTISNKWLFESIKSTGHGLHVIDESILDKYHKNLDVISWAQLTLNVAFGNDQKCQDEQAKHYHEQYLTVLRLQNDVRKQVSDSKESKDFVPCFGFNLKYLEAACDVFEKAMLADDACMTAGEKRKAKDNSTKIQVNSNQNPRGGFTVELIDNPNITAVIMPIRLKG